MFLPTDWPFSANTSITSHAVPARTVDCSGSQTTPWVVVHSGMGKTPTSRISPRIVAVLMTSRRVRCLRAAGLLKKL